jgi:hypothetical protein
MLLGMEKVKATGKEIEMDFGRERGSSQQHL